MSILDPEVHKIWLAAAARGKPPDPVDVAELQYQLDVPWHIRDHYFKHLRGLGTKKRDVIKLVREISRGAGKSKIANFIVLYAAEYIIPFLDIRPENRRIIIVGRDVNHIIHQNMDDLESDIAYYAPWLKNTDASTWGNPEALKESNKRTMGGGWSHGLKSLTNGVSIVARGFAQSVRGFHCYLMVLDDLVDEENYLFGRQQLLRIQGAMEKAVEYGGMLLIHGTPQSDGDVYDLLKAESGWDHVALPAIDESGELGYVEKNRKEQDIGRLPKDLPENDLKCLWPTRLPYDALMAERGTTKQSEITFLRERQLQRIVDSSLIVHPNDLAAAKDATIPYAKSARGTGIYAGVDPSTLKEDDAGIIIGRLGENGVRTLLHVEKIPAGPGDPLILLDRILALDERYGGQVKWLCEQNGYQGILMPLLQREKPSLLGRFDTLMLVSNKHKQDGFPLIRTIYESGKIKTPVGRMEGETTDETQASVITEELNYQLKGIRIIDGKVVEDPKRPNDLVSALFFFLKASEVPQEFTEVAVIDYGEKDEYKRRPMERHDVPKEDTPMGRVKRALKYERDRNRY